MVINSLGEERRYICVRGRVIYDVRPPYHGSITQDVRAVAHRRHSPLGNAWHFGAAIFWWQSLVAPLLSEACQIQPDYPHVALCRGVHACIEPISFLRSTCPYNRDRMDRGLAIDKFLRARLGRTPCTVCFLGGLWFTTSVGRPTVQDSASPVYGSLDA